MSHEQVEFSRECGAIQIPEGTTVTIPKGTAGVITQSLGDSYTVQVPSLGGLFRVDGKDADAIGREPKVTTTGPTAQAAGDRSVSEEMIWEQLREVYDPEIPVNVVDLGLIYGMRMEKLSGGGTSVKVQMTLTAPGCGMGPSIAMDARRRLESVPGVAEADVQLVWDPPWNPHMISPEGKAILGME